MKKNLITVIILALVLANLVMTAILMITILPETKKANELITEICSAIDLELKSGNVNTSGNNISIDKLATYDIADTMTVNLKRGEDGKDHYAVITVSLSMNTDSEGYETYGETIGEKESIIKSEINSVVSGYTYDEITGNQQEVQDAILKALQSRFDSDFIVSVGFPTVTIQ